jgi:hypothetical protein
MAEFFDTQKSHGRVHWHTKKVMAEFIDTQKRLWQSSLTHKKGHGRVHWHTKAKKGNDRVHWHKKGHNRALDFSTIYPWLFLLGFVIQWSKVMLPFSLQYLLIMA